MVIGSRPSKYGEIYKESNCRGANQAMANLASILMILISIAPPTSVEMMFRWEHAELHFSFNFVLLYKT
jgi:hypothetical protein